MIVTFNIIRLCRPYSTVLQDHVNTCDNEGYLTALLTSLARVDIVTKARAKLFESLLKRYFVKCVGDDRNPWRTIEKVSLQFVLRLRLDYLMDMELYLSLHLFIACKLRLSDNDQQRISFVDDLVNWLPNLQFSEANELYLLLLWSQVVCCSVLLYAKGTGSALLEKAEK